MKSVFFYILFLISIVIFADFVIFNRILGYGYPHHYKEENFQRFPMPYVEFIGKPNVLDHNSLGFRGDIFKPDDDSLFKIAFFGGSTGYNGYPTIIKLVENKLNSVFKKKFKVMNFSVVSSNHNQHLHYLLEYLPKYRPDLVIFYGGYNETVQSALYDPRPGYPYNFFYRSELSPLKKIVLENSGLIGQLDLNIGNISGIKKLRDRYKVYSSKWNKRILSNYLYTLKKAKIISEAFTRDNFKFDKFLAFYQPYQVPIEFYKTHKKIRDKITKSHYIIDVSNSLVSKKYYTDIVHVNQKGNELISSKIASVLIDKLKNNNYDK
jgi:hypothetical protein